MPELFIDEKYLDEIKSIIEKKYPNAVVWAYGSRVKGDAHRGSDLDLVVKSFGCENPSLATLEVALKDSNIPFLIDIFEFDNLPESFQTEIIKKHVEVYS